VNIKTTAASVLKKLRPPWWKGGIREITLFLVVYTAYSLTQDALPDRQLLAFHNTNNVIDFEKRLKIFWELSIQSWFLRSDFLVQLVNALYTLLFFPVLISFGIWAYKYHRQQYLIARNALFISAIIAFPCFVFYPEAPPRLLSDLGFVDTIATYMKLNISSMPTHLVNQFAAMPSLHMCWTLLVGIAIIRIAKTWWLKMVGILLPLLMFVTIVATANHFILDAIFGAAVAGLSYALALLFAKFKQGVSPRLIMEYA
jgi:uncharacterized membrane protein YoaK (UPF0700 family)